MEARQIQEQTEELGTLARRQAELDQEILRAQEVLRTERKARTRAEAKLNADIQQATAKLHREEETFHQALHVMRVIAWQSLLPNQFRW